MMRFIDGAMECVGRGWSVFPLAPGKKVPAIPAAKGGKGVLDASRDAEQVREWARKFPQANVGLACGRASGFTVIDIDPKAGGMQTIMALKDTKRILTPTISVRTPSGGWHLYYQFEPLLKNSKSLLGPGVDVRTTGGYVVAPPSRLKDGKLYSWHQPPIEGVPAARMPMWCVQKLKPVENAIFAHNTGAQNHGKAMEGLLRLVASARGGERNSCLYWAARRAFEMKALDQGTMMALAGAAGRAGISQKEALKTIGSAFKAVTGGKMSV